LGATSATNLVVMLPELGQVSGKEIARLVGVAPLTKQSGAQAEHGHIAGGRTEVRTALWMPVLYMAYRDGNPVLAAFAARLRAQGKPFHLIMIACIRKLLVILNAMRRDGTWWHAPAPAMT
jgi:transposase